MTGLMTLAEVAAILNCNTGHLYRIEVRSQQEDDDGSPPALFVKAASRDVVQRRLPKLRDANGAAVIEHDGVQIKGPFKVTRVCPRRRQPDGSPEDFTEQHTQCYCRARFANCRLRTGA